MMTYQNLWKIELLGKGNYPAERKVFVVAQTVQEAIKKVETQPLAMRVISAEFIGLLEEVDSTLGV